MSERFDAAVLADDQPLNPIAITVANGYQAKLLSRDIEDLGLSEQIVAIHANKDITGMRFRKLYTMEMDPYFLPVPIEQYFDWLNNEVRPRLDKNPEVVDCTCLSGSATLLQHIIETDVELPL